VQPSVYTTVKPELRRKTYESIVKTTIKDTTKHNKELRDILVCMGRNYT